MHIAGKYQIWCHIEGDNLPCLGTMGIPKKLAPVMACNSITLVSHMPDQLEHNLTNA